MLTKEEVQKYKERLEKERGELVADIEKDSKTEDFGRDSALDVEDEKADEAEEFANDLASAGVHREQVEEIDEALRRIEKGTYGKCVKCGGEIEKNVLDVVPESNLCAKCKA